MNDKTLIIRDMSNENLSMKSFLDLICWKFKSKIFDGNFRERSKIIWKAQKFSYLKSANYFKTIHAKFLIRSNEVENFSKRTKKKKFNPKFFFLRNFTKFVNKTLLFPKIVYLLSSEREKFFELEGSYRKGSLAML